MSRISLLQVVLLGVFLLSGCLEDRNYANQGPGDACRSTLECQPGLICWDQVCVDAPETSLPGGPLAPGYGPSERDAGGDIHFPDLPPESDGGPGNPDVPPDPDLPPDLDLPPDADLSEPDLCNPGERACFNSRVVRSCTEDGGSFIDSTCPPGTLCLRGFCEEDLDCIDRDGDDFPSGTNCPPEVILDCNDEDSRSYPGAPEICNGRDESCDGRVDENLTRACSTACGAGEEVCSGGRWAACSAPEPTPEVCNNGRDEDCDGQIDENCSMCCTPETCNPGEVCVNCACQEADPEECIAQNQPCDAFSGGNSTEYQCISFTDERDGLCLGYCNPSSDRPDDTCPDPNSVCISDSGDGPGACFSACDPVTQTGCYPGQGCIAARDTGICVEVGPLGEGEPCDEFTGGTFGQCRGGLACVEIDDEFGPACERLCNPLGSTLGVPGVCRADQACFAFGVDFGICTDSLGLPEGAECPNFATGIPCGDDIVCHPVRRRANSCQRQCRLDQGNADCIAGGRCVPSRLEQEGLGVCRQ